MTDDNVKSGGRVKLSFRGFADPVRRPRYIIWTVVAVLVFAAVMITALGVTSTRWFCAEGCHKVQDDTITAYEHSPHSEISCMACHMPVNANPVVFILHKAEALGELYLTVTNNFELPLNAESEVALTMPSTQCTQCHNLELRPVTPTRGIIIDHAKHAEEDIDCAICHNRTAHVEDFELTLTDPTTNEPNEKHEDFMTMTACFRCHTQDPVQGETEVPQAPGACIACHPKDFPLKPASHNEPGFYPEGHAVLASEETSRAREVEAEQKKAEAEGGEGEEGGHGGEESLGMSLPPVAAKTSCETCHSEQFCSDCHGVPMPHPPAFRKGHGEVGRKDPKVCERCHTGGTEFCTRCHHSDSLGYDYDPDKKWLSVHPQAVSQVGAAACLDCHNPTYCSDCHVNGPN